MTKERRFVWNKFYTRCKSSRRFFCGVLSPYAQHLQRLVPDFASWGVKVRLEANECVPRQIWHSARGLWIGNPSIRLCGCTKPGAHRKTKVDANRTRVPLVYWRTVFAFYLLYTADALKRGRTFDVKVARPISTDAAALMRKPNCCLCCCSAFQPLCQ